MLNLKIVKGTEYATGQKSKDVFEKKRLPLHGAFMPNKK